MRRTLVDSPSRASVGRGKMHICLRPPVGMRHANHPPRTLCGREIGDGWEMRRHTDVDRVLEARSPALCETCAHIAKRDVADM